MELSPADTFISGKWELAQSTTENWGERVCNIPAGDKLLTIKEHTHIHTRGEREGERKSGGAERWGRGKRSEMHLLVVFVGYFCLVPCANFFLFCLLFIWRLSPQGRLDFYAISGVAAIWARVLLIQHPDKMHYTKREVYVKSQLSSGRWEHLVLNAAWLLINRVRYECMRLYAPFPC